MEMVYTIDGDKHDFFDSVFFCNEPTSEWEDFLQETARYAAEPDSRFSCFTRFVQFMHDHGYMDQITDTIYEAQKAFVNERIDATGAPFDHC